MKCVATVCLLPLTNIVYKEDVHVETEVVNGMASVVKGINQKKEELRFFISGSRDSG